jgi:hypothetical protein
MLAGQWQPVELYHQRWAGDPRAVPQNDLICTHRRPGPGQPLARRSADIAHRSKADGNAPSRSS